MSARIVPIGAAAAAERPELPPIRIGATGAALTGGAVIAWVKAAEPGRVLRYASGSLPGWSGAGAVVTDLDARKIVFAWFKAGDYFIRRLSAPYSDPPSRPRVARHAEPTADDKARLLKVIQAEARAGQPASTNHVWAMKAGLSDKNRASYLLKLLIADGAIAREDSPWWPGRQISFDDRGTVKATFVEVGRAWPVGGNEARHPLGGK